MRAELENSEEGREHLAREQARVDAKRQTQAFSSSHKRPMSEEWDRLPGKAFRRVDEEDVTMRHDITAKSGAPSSSASGGPAMDIDSQPSRKRAADVQTEDLEDGEQTTLTEVDANESTLSLPQAEEESSDGRTFIGSWEHDVFRNAQPALARQGCRRRMSGPRRNYGHHDNEWTGCALEFHKRGDEESSVQEDSCGKAIFACWIRMTQRQKDDELHKARVHIQFICRMCRLRHEEGRYFLHEHRQSELPWREDCVNEVQKKDRCQADVRQ